MPPTTPPPRSHNSAIWGAMTRSVKRRFIQRVNLNTHRDASDIEGVLHDFHISMEDAIEQILYGAVAG